MADNIRIEAKIRELIASECDSITLSNALFAPSGLFSQLASGEDERRALTKTPLFKEAQQRVATLRKMEAQRFSQSVKAYEAAKPGAKLMFKVEQVPHS
jgi:hypothetical protein